MNLKGNILGSGVRMMAEYCSWSYMVVRSTLWYSKILLKITVEKTTRCNSFIYPNITSKIEIILLSITHWVVNDY